MDYKCTWLVERHGHSGECFIPDEYSWCVICESIAENGGVVVEECGADVTEHPNGWECAAGHSHFSDVEYYDDDELAGLASRNLPLAPNARRIDGSLV